MLVTLCAVIVSKCVRVEETAPSSQQHNNWWLARLTAAHSSAPGRQPDPTAAGALENECPNVVQRFCNKVSIVALCSSPLLSCVTHATMATLCASARSQSQQRALAAAPSRPSLLSAARRPTAVAASSSDKALWESLDPHRKALGGEASLPFSTCWSFAYRRSVHRPIGPSSARGVNACIILLLPSVDFGTVKCGLAVSTGGLAPRPLKV